MGAFDGNNGAQLQRALMIGAWLFVVLLVVGILYLVSSWRFVGEGLQASNTITVSGTGDAYAAPDTAEFTFSVVSDKPTVAEAQADEAQKSKAVTEYLTSAGVDAKDIQTTGYNINPTYEYQSAVCPQASGSTPVYCPPGKQVLTGYEVRQSDDVKVRDISKAGDLLSGVGDKGATEVSGLSFTVKDPTALQAQARDKAIADAKTKAQALAKSLGVSLSRIVSFNETNNQPPVPIYGLGGAAADSAKSFAPELSTGQNKITSNVSITYEIR